MQLVLDYEVGGETSTARIQPEQVPRLRIPGKQCELIDGSNEKRWTLFIGTVDKFALLPWYPEARSLFGLDTGGRCFPPDLVIQDELHLISGPLGSMVGHYETAIDELCTHERFGQRISAKIIASTATICRAGEQVQNLYGRKVFLFPPQGLKAGESFFAHEDAKAPGRLYVGVFATALSSHVTAQIRVMASS